MNPLPSQPRRVPSIESLTQAAPDMYAILNHLFSERLCYLHGEYIIKISTPDVFAIKKTLDQCLQNQPDQNAM